MTIEIQPGTVIGGKYRIEQSIGVGGFSVVFRATHIAMDRPVAIKVFDARRQYQADPERTKRYVRRFQKEAHLVSRLQHPNTVTIFDYGAQPEGTFYLVMEFIQGQTLADILTQQRQLTKERTLTIFLQILASLEEAHHLDILHRDLKPANIMISTTFKGEEQVKVLDFGVAQLLSEKQHHEISAAGKPIFLGTPRYAAPEQLRAGKLSFATDIFSVGALMWHCLLGQPMIPTGDVRQCIAIHRKGKPWLIPESAPIDATLKSIIEKAVHTDPQQRFADASAMLAALKAYGAAQNVAPPPLPPSSPFRRSSSEIFDPNVVGDGAHEDLFIGSSPALAPPKNKRDLLRPPVPPEQPPKPSTPKPRTQTPDLELEEIPPRKPQNQSPPPESPRQGNLLSTRSTRVARRLGRGLIIAVAAITISLAIVIGARIFLPAKTYQEVTTTITTTTLSVLPEQEGPRRSPFSAEGIRLAIQTRGWRIESSRDPIDMQRFHFYSNTVSRGGVRLDLTLYDVRDPDAMPEIIEQVLPPDKVISLGHMIVRINPRDSAGYDEAEELQTFLSLYRDIVLEEEALQE